jgi:dynein heavy chain, axonemal
MDETANSILAQIPQPVSIEAVTTKYPVLYEQSMNTVLVQEVIR